MWKQLTFLSLGGELNDYRNTQWNTGKVQRDEMMSLVNYVASNLARTFGITSPLWLSEPTSGNLSCRHRSAHVQNDAHTRLSNTALSVVAKDLETHQVSIHKVKSMTEYPDRMPYSCKKRLAKLSMDHRGGKAKVCARLKNIKCRTVCRVCCFCVKKKKSGERK